MSDKLSDGETPEIAGTYRQPFRHGLVGTRFENHAGRKEYLHRRDYQRVNPMRAAENTGIRGADRTTDRASQILRGYLQ